MAPQIPPNPASGPPETLTWVFEAEPPLEPSPVPREILENNNPPSETHIYTLQGFISRSIPRIARLDSKIAIIQAALDKTLAERALHDAEVRKHEGAASLLRSLPPEIMSSIFAFVPTPNLLGSDAGGPWSICAVCSRWRSIALSEPSLWTYIFLDFKSARDHEARSFVYERVSRLELHLERSAQSPLAVDFQSHSLIDDDIDEIEYFALDILQKHCHRWQTLRMRAPKPLFTHLDVEDSLLLLRALDIRVYPDSETTQEGVLELHTFANCPSLQVATVNRGNFRCPSDVILPFSQLLQYSAGNLRRCHLNAVRSASNLVDCALFVDDDLTPLPPNTQRIQLPNLLRLSVSGAEILRILDTPVLQEFYCNKQSTALLAFLKRLKRLQKLVVIATLSAGDTTLLLEAAPTITELGLYVPMDFAQEFLLAFTPSASSGSASKIPCLTTLSVGFISLQHAEVNPPLIDQDSIMRMFEGQWRDGHWRSVNFHCMRFTPSQDTLERLKVLREQGLKINLFRWPESLTLVMIPDYFDIWYDKPYDVQYSFESLHEAAEE